MSELVTNAEEILMLLAHAVHTGQRSMRTERVSVRGDVTRVTFRRAPSYVGHPAFRDSAGKIVDTLAKNDVIGPYQITFRSGSDPRNRLTFRVENEWIDAYGAGELSQSQLRDRISGAISDRREVRQ